MRQITSRDLNEHLKHGWTRAQFAERYQCTEEEFIDALEKTFSPKVARGFKNRLDENGHRANKKKRSEEKDELNEELVCDVEGEALDGAQEDSDTLENNAEEIKDLLKELTRKEYETQTNICDLESRILQSRSKKQKLCEEVNDQWQELKRLRQLVETVVEAYESTLLQINEIDSSVVSMKKELESQKELIVQVRAEIEDLKKIVILVYEDGKIEVEGPIQFSDPANWGKIYREFSHDEQFEEFTMRELKTLAKVVAFVQELQEDYEITFEDELLQLAFETLMKN